MSLLKNIAELSAEELASTFLKLDASNDPVTGALLLKNDSNSTTAFQIQQADGTVVGNWDTTNKRLGVGTDAPSVSAHIVGDDGAPSMPTLSDNTKVIIANNDHAFLSIITPNNKVGGITFDDEDTHSRGYIRYYHSDNSMQLFTNGSVRFAIDSSGNTGVGNTSPQGRFHVTGTADDQQLIVQANATQTSNIVEVQKSDGTVYSSFGSTGELFIDGTANVTQLKVQAHSTNTTVVQFEESGGKFLYNLSEPGLNFFRAVDNATSSASVPARFGHSLSSGTPTTNMGTAFQFVCDANGAISALQGEIQHRWVDAIYASRKARAIWSVDDSGGTREAFRYEADGTGSLVSFGGNVVNASAGFQINHSRDIIQAVIKANATQTANLVEFQASDTTVVSAIDNSGRGSFGADVNAAYQLRVETVGDSANDIGIFSNFSVSNHNTQGASRFRVLTNTGATNSKTGLLAPAAAIASMDGANAGDYTDVIGVAVRNSYSASGNVTKMKAFSAQPSAFSGAGALTSYYSYFVNAMSGIATNQYGLYVESIDSGTLNYSIFTNAGLNQLGDQLKVDGSQDVIQTIIQAHSSQTANILEIQKSDGTVYAGADERGILFSDGGIDGNSVYIGNDAGNIAHTNAIRNVGIGQNALKVVSTGDNNVAIGYLAMNKNTTGKDNMAVGASAMEKNTEGFDNMAIGRNALNLNTTGDNSSAVGSGALQSNTTNNGNTAIGAFALTTSDGGEANTAIGQESGKLITTGDTNIFIGNQSGGRQTTNSNLLIIDNALRADVATELTNSILYGVMAAAPADQTLRANSLFGVNTTPTAQLHVVGQADIIQAQVVANSSQTANIVEVQDSSGNLILGVDGVSQVQRGLDSELVSNGTFDSDLSDWTAGAGWGQAGGEAVHTPGDAETLTQDIAVVSGETYYVTLDVTRSAGTCTLTFGSMEGSYLFYSTAPEETFVATSTGNETLTFTPSSTSDVTLDNVTVKRLTGINQANLTIYPLSSNPAIEMRAGKDGSYSTFIGRFSGQSYYSGTGNTFVGYNAGTELTVGDRNTAVGWNAGLNITTGKGNTLFGAEVGTEVTVANSLCLFGYLAGQSLTTGGGNSFFGYQAGRYITTGANNTMFGSNAGAGLDAASKSNVGIGVSPLYGAGEVTGNIAIGSSALYDANDDYNVGIGDHAGSNTTAKGSLYFGYYSGYYATSGNYNVVLGYQAGRGASGTSTYANSIALGYQTGYDLTSGGNQVLLGFQSGTNLTTGTDNTLIGYKTGFTSVTGTRNIFVGANAGYRATGDDLLIIDNQARADVATELSNSILYGVMAAAPADQSLRINANLTTSQGRIKNTTRYTTTQAIPVTDEVVLANTDGGTWVATLPAGVEGQTMRVINTGDSGNALTVAPNGAEHLIGANSNFTLADGESLIVSYNGTDGWY